jgi:hypothetical protein
MSASDIIAEIQKLPVAEQEQVLEFLQHERERRENGGKVRYASDTDFEKSAEKVLRENAELFCRLAQ